MRIARIAHAKGMSFAEIDAETATVKEIAEHPFGEPTFTGQSWSVADIRLLAPILPTKVVCIGKNYADHAKEMGGEAPADPVIFMKPSTSVIGPNSEIKLPPSSTRVDFEGELAVVIGRPCRDVKAAQAKSVILGYTIGNDVTARDQQATDGQWTRAKGYDTFCPLGPWIDTTIDPADLSIKTEVDGAVKQDSRTSQLLHDIPAVIEWISAVMTLLPGDVILTGTPAGVGPLADGNTVTVSIEGLGMLSNPVVNR